MSKIKRAIASAVIVAGGVAAFGGTAFAWHTNSACVGTDWVITSTDNGATFTFNDGTVKHADANKPVTAPATATSVHTTWEGSNETDDDVRPEGCAPVVTTTTAPATTAPATTTTVPETTTTVPETTVPETTVPETTVTEITGPATTLNYDTPVFYIGHECDSAWVIASGFEKTVVLTVYVNDRKIFEQPLDQPLPGGFALTQPVSNTYRVLLSTGYDSGVVTVPACEVPVVATGTPPVPTAPPAGLPNTGTTSAPTVLTASALLLGGIVAVSVARRRKVTN